MSSPVENVVIVGTGCAGLTAAIYTGRANLNPLVIEGSLPGGQLTTTSEVENFPGFPHGIDGFQLMQNLREQATKFGARFEQAQVLSVDFTSFPRKLVCGDRVIHAKSVIISTGASPRMTGVPGEKELYGGKGVTTCERGRGGALPHPFRQQGLSRSSPRHPARFQDHGRSRHFAP
jgi:thioredoxin reductase (NADPH)